MNETVSRIETKGTGMENGTKIAFIGPGARG